MMATWLAHRVSRLLERQEREAVLGDLEEAGASPFAISASILGLVTRRQLALWKDWHPWLALAGVAAFTGFFLSLFTARLSTELFLQVRTYWVYGVHYGSGVTASQDVCHLIVFALVLACWSWCSGYVLARLSGRALWLTGVLFFLVMEESSLLYSMLSGNLVPLLPLPLFLLLHLLPLNPSQFLILGIAGYGVYRGSRTTFLPFNRSMWLSLSVLTLTLLLSWSDRWYAAALQKWSGGTWPPAEWTADLPLVYAGWPCAYILFFLTRFQPKEANT